MSASNRLRSTTLLVTLGILCLFSAGVALYFAYDNRQIKENIVKMEEKISADSMRVVALDAEFQETLTMLHSYKGLNRTLDSLIAVKEMELKKCRLEFMTLVRRNRISEEECAKQYANLRTIDSTFRAQITQLQAANKLSDIARDSLGRLILVQRDSLTLLKSINKTLSKKVTLAMLLKPTAIDVTPYRTKNNGKDAKTGKAAKLDQLKICYTLPKNELAEADTQVFFIRIINPEGTTYTSPTGTRMFTSAESGQPLPYSISSTIHYKKEIMTPCVYFRQDVQFIRGTYTIEIYQNGYLVGSTNFDLK